MTDWSIKLYFSTIKILAQRPTHISVVVATNNQDIHMKYHDRRIETNTASIIITVHVKRDSDCNGNEKDNSEKQFGREVNNNQIIIYAKHVG